MIRARTFFVVTISWLVLSGSLHADAPAVTHLEIQPGPRTVHAPAKTQQLAALAHFTDGASRNVTRLTVFTSSDAKVATVNDNGLVSFHQTGEVVILCRYLTTTQGIRLTFVNPRPGYRWRPPPEVNYIDKHVYAQLQRLCLPPSDRCNDAEFIRRAYLDACGMLPTSTQVRQFLAERDDDRRTKLIDRLLASPEYVDFWTHHWVEALEVSPWSLGEQSARAYQAWIRDHVKKNTPIDQFVRELLTAQGHSEKSGAANYFRVNRKPSELAEVTAAVFLGIRLECASCHSHYLAPWTQDDHNGFSAFFAQIAREGKPGQAEVISIAPKGEWLHPQTRQIVPAKVLGGAPRPFKAGEDRRAILADWIATAENPFFAKAFVNRVWSKMFGKGIVEPIDDARLTNPPANGALLDALAADFALHRFDMKHVIRTIMNSRTYQLSGKANDYNEMDQRYFSRRIAAPLSDVVIFDAIVAVTDVPHSFKGMPAGTRRVQVLDRELSFSDHLVFGPRRLWNCGRDPLPPLQLTSPWQYLEHRLTSDKSRVARLLAQKLSDKEILDEMCLTILSRFPDPALEEKALDYIRGKKDRTRAWQSIAWALMNSGEFKQRN